MLGPGPTGPIYEIGSLKIRLTTFEYGLKRVSKEGRKVLRMTSGITCLCQTFWTEEGMINLNGWLIQLRTNVCALIRR